MAGPDTRFRFPVPPVSADLYRPEYSEMAVWQDSSAGGFAGRICAVGIKRKSRRDTASPEVRPQKLISF